MNIEARTLQTDAERAFVEAFRDGGAGEAPRVRQLRQEAQGRFRASGLPHRRIEDWKYTDLRALLRSVPVGQFAATTAPVAIEGAVEIVIEDGRLAGTLPQIGGVQAAPLAEVLASGDADAVHALELKPARGHSPTLDLNAAFLGLGALLRVGSGSDPEQPILVRHRAPGRDVAGLHSRLVVIVEDDARLTLVETFEGGGALRNAATQIVLGKGASLEHIRVVDESAETTHLANVLCEAGEGARYRQAGLVVGGRLHRTDISLTFSGEDANAEILAASLLVGGQHSDVTLFVDHAVPGCTSRERFRAVLGGNARGVFQGKILVRPDAQKTDGQMGAHALLLTENAEMDAKPELEIYADDVTCGHGATVGQLDEELLFYLRARGLPERQAKALLIAAFVGEVMEAVENEAAREAFSQRTQGWIEGAEI